jgi:hypothetical protein
VRIKEHRPYLFKAEFFSVAMKENANDATTRVTVDGVVEPKVFKAMLHFIYAYTLPKFDPDEELVWPSICSWRRTGTTWRGWHRCASSFSACSFTPTSQ